MASLLTKPEVEFRVGTVRASIWRAISAPAIDARITIATTRDDNSETATLRPDEIPKAMLALKKAYNYLQYRQGQPSDAGDFSSAHMLLPERIP